MLSRYFFLRPLDKKPCVMNGSADDKLAETKHVTSVPLGNVERDGVFLKKKLFARNPWTAGDL